MTDVADHDIQSIQGRYQCPVCKSWRTWIAERSGYGSMTVEKIVCSNCGYDERYHGGSRFEKPKLWRRIFGGNNGR